MAYTGVEEEVITEKISITKFQLFFVLIQSQIGIGLFLYQMLSKNQQKGTRGYRSF